ncbi:MAG: type I-E CRISPR-associated protein Cas7/Cse4/CasC, partial [Chloroflexota bacterium]
TAPYACAECVVLETGDAQPRSLANAFLRPVHLNPRGTHPMEESVKAMAQYLDALENMYGTSAGERFVSSLHPWPREGDDLIALHDAIDRSLNHVFGRTQ